MSDYPWKGKKATYYVDEVSLIKRMLADAQTENKAMKAANRDLQDWFDDARATAEQAHARVAELEHSLTELIQHYSETWDRPILQRAEAARNGSGCPWLLRKQAEAVEGAEAECDFYYLEGSDTPAISFQGLHEYAQRLRQQADELEAGGGRQQ